MYRLGVVAVRSNEYPLLATQYQIHECISFWVFRCFYIINDFVFGLSTNLFEDAANPHDFPLNRCNCAELILFIQFAFLPTHTQTHKHTYNLMDIGTKNLSLFHCASRFSANSL